MKKLQIIFLLVSVNLFAQNSSAIVFDDLKIKIEERKINFENLGTTTEELNNSEIEVLELLNNSPKSLEGKKIAFITGPSGTTISDKIIFFNSFKNYYSKHNRNIKFNIVELNDKQKVLSGVDVIVYNKTKTYNHKSKILLRRIKQTKHT